MPSSAAVELSKMNNEMQKRGYVPAEIRTGNSPWPALGPTQPPIQRVPGLFRG